MQREQVTLQKAPAVDLIALREANDLYFAALNDAATARPREAFEQIAEAYNHFAATLIDNSHGLMRAAEGNAVANEHEPTDANAEGLMEFILEFLRADQCAPGNFLQNAEGGEWTLDGTFDVLELARAILKKIGKG